MTTRQVAVQVIQSFGPAIRSLMQMAIFAAVCLASTAPAAIPATALPAFTSHMTDLAQIMGRDAVDIDSRLKLFEKATGHQMFVLTVKSTGEQSIEEYAVNVFQKWKIGGAGIDNGVLFVIAVDDRRMRIEVGYGLEGVLTDLQCARIIHDIVAPQFEQGRHVAGIQSGVDAILGMLAPAAAPDGTRVAPSESYATGAPSPEGANGAMAFVLILSIAIVVGSIWFGLAGLALVGLFALAVISASKAGANGSAILVPLAIVWLGGRWFLIKNNVRSIISNALHPLY